MGAFELVVDGVSALSAVLQITRLALALDSVTLVRWLWMFLLGLATIVFSLTFVTP